MVRKETPICEFNKPAVDFKLTGVDEKIYTLKDVKGENGLLVMFICNHCPYVKSIINKIIVQTKKLKNFGINSVAIMANDTNQYEEDSFLNMQKISAAMNFSFPYLIDETQQVAKKYGAICTPDFFGYNKNLLLQYRGRLDSSKDKITDNINEDLFNAMIEIAGTNKGPDKQMPSLGCSIKWKIGQ